ncbi:hypothetical protein GCM10010124_28490 [Pilimelia terevasa]|uniref:Uncharacterized protein n=1 Tax=Pilimelia terevasa TaxID=53372 RepID=A0A8J3BSI0_9ACTN|nr:hypothetical protein [Pilimelia terevasa]GGK34190.1 hypothetical protein GCM10010124_28490 [Pilimelia terevasa]
MSSRRRATAVRAAALLLAVATGGACAGGPADDPGAERPSVLAADAVAPEEVVAVLTSGLTAEGPYREPGAAAARRAGDAFARALAAGTPPDLGALDYETRPYRDPAGPPYALTAPDPADRRGLPFLLAYGQGRPAVLVEAPHPRADRHSERIAARLAAATPRSYLLVAGAHRDAADGRADVAHRPESLFHALAARAAAAGVPQVQVHGYADDSLPGYDAVVSTGATDRLGGPARVADALARAGWRVCRAWQRRCGDLEGRTNAQGRAAAAAGAAFVHLELSRGVREDPAGVDRLVAAVGPLLDSLHRP